MIHSATDDLAVARKMADTLKREVNKHYKCMEIDIDGVMKSMLLLKKKKYAALMIEEKNGETVHRLPLDHSRRATTRMAPDERAPRAMHADSDERNEGPRSRAA